MSHQIYSLLGASSHAATQRAENDLYCTHPLMVENLLSLEKFHHTIWEPCCGLGHISDVLERHGHEVRKSDIVSRRNDIQKLDFLDPTNTDIWDGDIITNPPYSYATAMVRKALSLLPPGRRLAMCLRILFLESLERKKLFLEYPPTVVYISSRRIPCAKNGDFSSITSSAQGFAWFIWDKGFYGQTFLKWF